MGGGVRTSSRTNHSRQALVNRTLPEDSRTVSSNETSPRKRVFISFHNQDETMVNLLRHQAKDDRFDLDFIDSSVKEPFDSHWRARVRERIEQSSVVTCMIGAETHDRKAVLWEINTAYAMGKKVIGVRLHRDEDHIVPEPLIRNNAKIVYWNVEDIQGAIDKKKRQTR